MNIQLISTKATSLHLEASEQSSGMTIAAAPVFYEEMPRNFTIDLTVECFHREGFVFKVVYCALFAANEDITDEFKQSNFVKVNAPAIAYPFLRAYLANLMLSSGFDPLMLPTINFTKFEGVKHFGASENT